MSKVLFATSMDPFHLGHLNTALQFQRQHEQVVVGLGVNPSKKGFFSDEDRLHLARISLPEEIEVVSYTGTTIEFARSIGANILGRGLRTGHDLNYEAELQYQNEALAAEKGYQIDTFYVLATSNIVISSSKVRELISLRIGKKALEKYLTESAAEWIVNTYYKRKKND